MRPLLLASLIAFTLSACGNVSLRTAAALSQQDPLTADPAQFAIRLTKSDALRVTPGSEMLSYIATQGATGQRLGGDYPLLSETTDGGSTIYRLSPAAAAEIREIQSTTQSWAKDGRNSLSIGFGLDACVTPFDRDPSLSVDIRLAPEAPFRPLLRPTTLSDIAATIGGDATRPCEPA